MSQQENTKQKGRLGVPAILGLIAFLSLSLGAGLWFLKASAPIENLPTAKTEAEPPKTSLPSRPEETWSYIKELEQREVPIEQRSQALNAEQEKRLKAAEEQRKQQEQARLEAEKAAQQRAEQLAAQQAQAEQQAEQAVENNIEISKEAEVESQPETVVAPVAKTEPVKKAEPVKAEKTAEQKAAEQQKLAEQKEKARKQKEREQELAKQKEREQKLAEQKEREQKLAKQKEKEREQKLDEEKRLAEEKKQQQANLKKQQEEKAKADKAKTAKSEKKEPTKIVASAAKPNEKAANQAGRFGLQCGAFKNKAQAENMQARLAMAGFNARISSSSDWNRVFVGPVGDRAAASRAQSNARSVYECIIVSM